MIEIHRLTGSILIDRDGRGMGNESAGVVSRHRKVYAAARKMRQLRTDSWTRYEAREDGKRIDLPNWP